MRLRIATILAFAAACTSSERDVAPVGDVGGTLIIALPAEPSTMMPPLLRYAQEKEIADQVFDFLAEIGPDLNSFGDAGFTPRLAESWQWAADSLSIAFRLHPLARWHDGRSVTSSDVRFSVELNKDPRAGSNRLAALADVDSVSTPDSLTAVVWYARRSPEQFYNVAYSIWVLPEHLLRDADRATLGAHPFARNPVGSGPFRFVRWEARSVIEVAADTAYHLGRPLLDRVIWTLNPDASSALVKVLAGEADLFEFVTTEGMVQLAGQTLVRAVPYANPNYGYLGFNFRDPKNPSRPHPLFGDRGVRRAVAMAIDRRALVKNVFDSLAYLGAGPFSRMMATADTTLDAVPYDSAGADRLLDSLGWRDRDGDGVRDKDGRPLRFAISYPASSPPRRRYAELIQAQLRPHGVRVDVDGTDIASLGPRLYSSQFDAILNSWAADPSPSAIHEGWHTMPPASRANNFQLYSNPAVDAAIERAMSERDPMRSRMHYRRAYQAIMDDVAAVWLYENRYFMALNRRVQPVLKGSDAWWRHLRLWSIPAANRLPRDAR